MVKLSSEYELYHHGILGQKWGIRRFQNKDGSYTAEGKERRAQSEERKEKIKKAIKIGAAVAATALVAYGAYKINSKSKGDSLDDLDRSIANGKKMVEYYMKKKKMADAVSKGYEKTANIYWDRADKARDEYYFGNPKFKEANSENLDRLMDLGSNYMKKSSELLRTAHKAGTYANELGMVLDKFELDRKYPWAQSGHSWKKDSSEYARALETAVDSNNRIDSIIRKKK